MIPICGGFSSPGRVIMVRVGAMVWDGPFHALGRGEGLVGCVQSRELGAQTRRLPRFILPVSFSDTLLVVLI